MTIPSSVTNLGGNVFSGCYLMTNAIIGNSFIVGREFYECSSLTTVTIGNSVTTIGDSAFSGCTSAKQHHVP